MHLSSLFERMPLAKLLATAVFAIGSNAYAAEQPSSAQHIFRTQADLCHDGRGADAALFAADASSTQIAELCRDSRPGADSPARGAAGGKVAAGWELVTTDSAAPAAPPVDDSANVPALDVAGAEPGPAKLDFISDLPSSFAQKTAALSGHISSTFNVDRSVSDRVASAAMRMGWAAKVPPSLILAVISVESSFNVRAKNGHATGLMQIIPFWHKDKVNAVGGPVQLAKIENNIAAGAKILQEYLARSGGNMYSAIYHYNASSHAGAYAEKVMLEQKKFEMVLNSSSTLAAQ